MFKEALSVCLLIGMIISFLLLLMPGLILMLYGIEESPLRSELIKCIRYCSVGLIAASAGGFLSDYYGNMGKPFWSCMMVIFRTALFPILFCVTLSLGGGIVAMGKGMLLAQIAAIAIFSKNKVLGECVIRFIGEPEIIIKDNGQLFKPDIEDERYSYSILLSSNRSRIRI